MFRRPTLDGIRCQGEWRTSKTDERYAPGQFRSKQPDRLEDVSKCITGIEASQATDVLSVADRIFKAWALPLDKIKREAHGLERQE